jgi:hypothetical protein
MHPPVTPQGIPGQKGQDTNSYRNTAQNPGRIAVRIPRIITPNRRWKMKTFNMLTNRQFAAQVNGLIKSGPQQVWHFWNLAFNAISRTNDTKDVSHVNKMVAAARAVGRYRAFMAVATGLVCFPADKQAGIFSGKLQKGKWSALNRPSVEDDPASAKIWEVKLREYVEQEQNLDKTARKVDWSMERAVLTLVRKAEKEGKTVRQIIAEVERADKKLHEAA